MKQGQNSKLYIAKHREKKETVPSYLESSVQSQASARSRVCFAGGTRRAGETRVGPFLILQEQQAQYRHELVADVYIDLDLEINSQNAGVRTASLPPTEKFLPQPTQALCVINGFLVRAVYLVMIRRTDDTVRRRRRSVLGVVAPGITGNLFVRSFGAIVTFRAQETPVLFD